MTQLPLTTTVPGGTMNSPLYNSIYNVSTNSVPYTIGPSTVMQAPNSIDWSSLVNSTSTSVLELPGESADIKLNGKSLTKTLKAIEERLAWLEPNSIIEKEWNELKELGDQYRTLEAKIKEKMSVWEKLKT
jgi:flagellar motility protein MotE (MotC chaperone)